MDTASSARVHLEQFVNRHVTLLFARAGSVRFYTDTWTREKQRNGGPAANLGVELLAILAADSAVRRPVIPTVGDCPLTYAGNSLAS